jgi:hypothetical protein
MSASSDSGTINDLRFPIGRYHPPNVMSEEWRTRSIAELDRLPQELQHVVEDLDDRQLDTPYRPDGWTIRQVVHHLPDSHLNSYVRFRLALTEDSPVIKPYEEAAWAELPDAMTAPIQPSLQLLSGLHARYVLLLQSLRDNDFARTFRHPELGEKRLDWTLGLYAWHGQHHVAHIRSVRQRNHW